MLLPHTRVFIVTRCVSLADWLMTVMSLVIDDSSLGGTRKLPIIAHNNYEPKALCHHDGVTHTVL